MLIFLLEYLEWDLFCWSPQASSQSVSRQNFQLDGTLEAIILLIIWCTKVMLVKSLLSDQLGEKPEEQEILVNLLSILDCLSQSFMTVFSLRKAGHNNITSMLGKAVIPTPPPPSNLVMYIIFNLRLTTFQVIWMSVTVTWCYVKRNVNFRIFFLFFFADLGKTRGCSTNTVVTN